MYHSLAYAFLRIKRKPNFLYVPALLSPVGAYAAWGYDWGRVSVGHRALCADGVQMYPVGARLY